MMDGGVLVLLTKSKNRIIRLISYVIGTKLHDFYIQYLLSDFPPGKTTSQQVRRTTTTHEHKSVSQESEHKQSFTSACEAC
jgi:hypothetical protein